MASPLDKRGDLKPTPALCATPPKETSEVLSQAVNAQNIHRFSTADASGHLLVARRQQLNFGPQRWVSLLEGLQVDLFVITGASFPAMKQDPNPFERQHPQGGMMAFARRRSR